MTHVVCQPCYDCKYTDCVAVCPVECFWQDERMLYIDPEVCIDCEACIPECPVVAIWLGPSFSGDTEVAALHPDQRRAGRRPEGSRRRPHHRQARSPGRPRVQEEQLTRRHPG